MLVTDAVNRAVRLTCVEPGTWGYAWIVRPGSKLRVWVTHNKRKRKTTTHVTYIKDRTTPEELQAAIDAALVPSLA